MRQAREGWGLFGASARAGAALAATVVAAAALAGCAGGPRAYYSPSRTRASTFGGGGDGSPKVTAAPEARGVAAPPGGVADRAGAWGDVPVETRQFVPAEYADQEIRIACKARTLEDEIVDGLAIPTLRVRIWIYNYSRHALELRPEEFCVIDDLGRELPTPRAEQEGKRRSVVLAVAPVRTAVDLVFRLPEGYDPRGPRSLRLFWGFRIDDREYRHETLFEPGRDGSFRDPFLAIAPRSS